jgi:hypothetical protein
LTLNQYIDSDFALIVQDDGHIVNENMWSDEFLEFDYIGAPWPNSRRWKSRFYNKYNLATAETIARNVNHNQVGNGGFSLRSKKFLEYSSKFNSCQNIDEDIFLCIYNYQEAIRQGIEFAPTQLAKDFSYEIYLTKLIKYHERSNKKFDINNHFGWHGKRFTNYESLLNLKNLNS